MTGSRPVAVFLCTLLFLTLVLRNAPSTLTAPDIRTVLLCSAVIMLPGGIGAVGFWFMRWWSLIGAAVMSLGVLLLTPYHALEDLLVWSFAPFLIALVVAVAYRRRFKW